MLSAIRYRHGRSVRVVPSLILPFSTLVLAALALPAAPGAPGTGQASAALVAAAATATAAAAATATAAAAATATAAPPESSAGRLQPDPVRLDPPSKSYDLLHTTLDLELDLQRGRVEGTARHRIRMLRDGVESVSLHASDLQIYKTTVGGAEVPFERHSDELSIRLQGLAQHTGDDSELAVAYGASPVTGLHFRRPSLSPGFRYEEAWSQGEDEENRCWFPGWDYPNDLASYTGIFTVAAGIKVLSNGLLAERTESGGKVRYRYEQKEPQANYLVMVAAAAYEVYTEVLDGKPDAAGAVTLECWVPPGTGEQLARASFAITAPALRFFGQYTQVPYPWGKYAQVVVQDFIYGGMENASATVLHARSLVPQAERAARDADDLLAHEAAHQWFGDLMTCYGWKHMWLNEGFATYFNALFSEQQYGPERMVYELDETHSSVLRADAQTLRPLVSQFYNRIDDQQSANVYSKGASVLHMLHGLLGDDPFRRGIVRYCATHAHTLVTTEDFQRAMTEATGETLDWFFEQWVYLPGHPHFAVDYAWDDASRTASLRVRQTQGRGQRVPLFRVPVEVEFGWNGGGETRRFWVEDEQSTLTASLPQRPSMVIFDPAGWLLKELEFPRSQEQLLFQLAHATRFWSRVEAIRALGELRVRDEDAVAAIAGILASASRPGSGQERLRADAAAALGKIGGTEARDALLAQLPATAGTAGAASATGAAGGAGSAGAAGGASGGTAGGAVAADSADAPRVRVACASALQQFPADGVVVRALAETLQRDASRHVRAEALRALVKLKADGARKLCLEALAQPSDREVMRATAVDGLAELKAQDTLPEVLRWMRPGADRDLRLRAMTAAATLVQDGPDKGGRDRVAAELEKLLDDPLARIRTAAARTLGDVGARRSLEPLRHLAADDRIASVRKAAEAAVKQMESPPAKAGQLDTLRRELKDLQQQVDGLKKGS